MPGLPELQWPEVLPEPKGPPQAREPTQKPGDMVMMKRMVVTAHIYLALVQAWF